MGILEQPVLVLNRNWQAVNVTDVMTAITDCAKGQRTIIDTRTPIDMRTLDAKGRRALRSKMRPVTWDEWVNIPPGPNDRVIHTVNKAIRVPTVIAALNYDRMPKKRPKLSRKAIEERDGKRCIYTDKVVENGTLDHVMPRSRGGKDVWENLGWCDPKINQMKANRTPEEAGLKIRPDARLKAPAEIPACRSIKAQLPDWLPFLS